jgi:HEAT repeat protein
MKLKRIILYSIPVIAVVAVAAGFVLRALTRVEYPDPLLAQWSRLRKLGVALRAHANYNDGRFPARLEDLVPECLPKGEPCLQFHDWRTREAIDWIYFGGHSARDRGDTILVASPKAFSPADGTHMVGAGVFRVVFSVDGRGAVLTEADYQACIAEQQAPEWSAHNDVADDWDFVAETRRRNAEATAQLETRRRMNPPKDISHLLEALRKGDETAPAEAANSLGEIGAVAPEIVPALVAALAARNSRDSSFTAYCAAQALGAISVNDAHVAPALLEALKSSKGNASLWVIAAWKEVGSRDEAAIPFLIEALESKSSDMRCEAAEAIAGIGPSAVRAMPKLMALLADKDSCVATRAAVALGRIGPGAREAIPALAAQFNASEKRNIDIGRALWKIDPAQSAEVVPALIAEVERQRNSNAANHAMDTDFYSAIELLGAIGPEARAAIPILQANLRGGALMHAAWALWRIDPAFSEAVTPVLLRFLHEKTRPDRLDRMAQGFKFARHFLDAQEEMHVRPFGPLLAAAGALWQMHPEKREAMRPLIAALLREWESEKVLNDLSPDTTAAIPALEDMEKGSERPETRLLARAALRKIGPTDYGICCGVLGGQR